LYKSDFNSYGGEEGRGDYTFNELKNLGLFDVLENPKEYLDVGTGSGIIPDVIAKHIGIEQTNVYSIDVNNSEIDFKGKSNFSRYEGKELPFEKNKFDMITSFMVFHHVESDILPILLKSIYNCLTSTGILIIKEHSYETNLENYIDVEHDIYELIRNQEFTTDHKCTYYSFKQLKEIIEKVGFTLHSVTPEYKIKRSPSRGYYAIFKKNES
jgi:SAM-dependent methyltransferase